MNRAHLIATVGTLIGAALLAPAAQATTEPRSVPAVRTTTVSVSWPGAPLPWGKRAYVTATVSPAQAGRVVRLDMWGQGGPVWSRIDRKATDASGMVRLSLFTMCPDSPCAAFTDKYRVVVLPAMGLTGAQALGTVTVVP